MTVDPARAVRIPGEGGEAPEGYPISLNRGAPSAEPADSIRPGGKFTKLILTFFA